MPSLPFAPRPLASEGLSSWVARLAVHNFVTATDFWSGLGCDDPQDLAPPDGLFDQLSEATRLDANELRRFFAPDLATIAAPLALSRPAFIRGAACPACCRDAADKGGDHFVSASSASLWRVSCPKHRVRLACAVGGASWAARSREASRATSSYTRSRRRCPGRSCRVAGRSS